MLRANKPASPTALSLGFILLVAAFVSFCGMSYELVLIRLLSTSSGDGVSSQSLTAGFFLLALGLGAYLYGRLVKSFDWFFLVRIEVALSIVAVFSLPTIAIASIYIESKTKLIFTAQIITLAIGTLSGFELPALMDAAKPLTKRWFGAVLAANYGGALIASLLIPTHMLPHFGLYLTGWLLALASAGVACAIFLRNGQYKPRLLWIGLAASIFLPPLAANHLQKFEQFYLKSFYYVAPASLSPSNIEETLRAHAQYPRVRRISTPYQDLDIVQADLSLFGMETRGDFHLFIDQHKQFSRSTETIYHDTIIHGGLNLANQVPKKVAIIGGGDGLMIRELLKYPDVESITLVELDPEMIRLFSTDPALKQLNENSLESKKVKIEITDGFTWVRDQKELFDTIIVDLPHPVSTDLSRLYSFEFYSFVKRSLAPHGFMILDFPFDGILKSSPEGTTNRKTLRAVNSAITNAGFSSRAIFGSWECFLIASAEPREFKFNYEKLSPKIHDHSVFNMTLMKLDEPAVQPNTVYQPVTLKPSSGDN